MEIILKQDILKVGYKDEIIKVKDGFARNYLIPKGFAIESTSSNRKILAETLKQRAFKEDKIKNEAKVLADKLQGLAVKIGAKAGATGKIFGSVNSIQIADAIKNQHSLEVDRKKIFIDGDIVKELGNYKAKVIIYKDITASIDFEVIAE